MNEAQKHLERLSRPQLERVTTALLHQAAIAGAMLDTFLRDHWRDLGELSNSDPVVRERAALRLREWEKTVRRIRTRQATIRATFLGRGTDDILPDGGV